MLGYLAAFEAFNRGEIAGVTSSHTYGVSFWSPQLTPEVYLGDHLHCSPSTGDRTLTLLSTTYEGGSHAGFDDAEQYVKHSTVAGFGSTGLVQRTIAKDEESFVQAVQAQMRTIIAEKIITSIQ